MRKNRERERVWKKKEEEIKRGGNRIIKRDGMLREKEKVKRVS